MIKIVRKDDWRERTEATEIRFQMKGLGVDCCTVCGRKATHYVTMDILDNETFALAPDEPPLEGCDETALGWQPIGPDCARRLKIPKKWLWKA